MVFKKWFMVFVIFLCVLRSFGQLFEGSNCQIRRTNTPGICTLIEHCMSAREGIRLGDYPQICAFRKRLPIVCCTDEGLIKNKNETKIPDDRNQVSKMTTIGTPSTFSASTEKPSGSSSIPTRRPVTVETSSIRPKTNETTSKRPVVNETTSQKPSGTPSGAGQVPVKRLPIGEISKQKCREYSQFTNSANCKIQTSDLFFKNVAQNGEFPHQALLGYDASDGRKIWKCSGTLISERYILTAARCINQLHMSEPKFVRLGDLNLQVPNGVELQEYKIEKIITHPEYKDPVTYNDIGLIKLSKNVIFNEKIRPACLQVLHYVERLEPSIKYVAVNWNGNQVSKLRIENVDMKCSEIYDAEDELFLMLTFGIIPDLQICASPFVKDTCQNSENDLAGGSIQIPHQEVQCSYELVALTSNGIPCGTTKPIPGIYTRISYYVEWIENIVWYS